MSSSQLQMLDSLVQVAAALEGIEDPDELEEGDLVEVLRGRVVAEPTSAYRPAASLDEDGQTPGRETAGQAPYSPWQSVLAGATSLGLASEAEGLSEEVRQELREQARAQAETARVMQAAEAERARETAGPESYGPVVFLPEPLGWGPPGRMRTVAAEGSTGGLLCREWPAQNSIFL